MSAWITDRLPTEGEADVFGDVTVSVSPDLLPCYDRLGVYNQNWTSIVEGTPWMTPNHPEPYVKPKRYTMSYQGIIKNGMFLPWTETSPEERKAMTDALNRLEEGV